jgi:phosphoglycerate dehydrogenase-like enzyme
VALTDIEAAEFFPGPMWNELGKLLPDFRHLRLPLQNPEEWPKLWAGSPAEILVCAWQTPALNGPLSPLDLQPLKYVCYLAGSVRRLVPRELVQNGLVVTNWGASIAPTVAECALMLILMALRRASNWAIAMHREGAWKNGNTVTQSLLGRSVGLHGFGVISQSLVPMLRPFTNTIRAYSPRIPDEMFARYGVARVRSLEELFSTSDVVVELAAATPENYHLVTESHLRMIPEGGVFVNVGRGSVVDEAALARVARDAKIQIALDVFEKEPLPVDSPLRGLPNVTLLPHLGGPTRDRRHDSGALALRNLSAYLRGEPQEAVVTLDVYDRST